MTLRGLSPALLWVLVLAAATLSAEAQSGPAAGRNEVVLGLTDEPRTLHPIFLGGADSAGDEILRTMFIPAVEVDANWRYLPKGVEALPTLADGTWKVDGERMTLLWRLRRRNWHDGRPVTCGDYLFTWTVARDERVRSTSTVPIDQAPIRRISAITCPRGAGGLEISVQWKERSASANLAIIPFVGRRWDAALPRHIFESIYRQQPGRLWDVYSPDPQLAIGDGAYRLLEWRKGSSLSVVAVQNHPVFGSPKITRITWRFASDADLISNFLRGDLDVSPFVVYDPALETQFRATGGARLVFSPPTIWEHIDLNLDNPLLQDLRVRRALAHGINRTRLVQELFKGRQPVAHSYLAPRHQGYTEDLPRYPYDPARAKALLAQAGFTLGQDGVLRSASGQRLSLELASTEGAPVRLRVSQVIQQQMGEIGVEIVIANYPRRVFFTDIVQRRHFKAMAMYAWAYGPSPDCGNYTSGAIPSEANGWVGGNYPGFRNVEMDQICKAIRSELDEAKRTRLLRTSASIVARDLPVLPLYYRSEFVAVKEGLQNIAPTGDASPLTWNAHTWYWR